jgi:hypothetical protein
VHAKSPRIQKFIPPALLADVVQVAPAPIVGVTQVGQLATSFSAIDRRSVAGLFIGGQLVIVCLCRGLRAPLLLPFSPFLDVILLPLGCVNIPWSPLERVSASPPFPTGVQWWIPRTSASFPMAHATSGNGESCKPRRARSDARLPCARIRVGRRNCTVVRGSLRAFFAAADQDSGRYLCVCDETRPATCAMCVVAAARPSAVYGCMNLLGRCVACCAVHVVPLW